MAKTFEALKRSEKEDRGPPGRALSQTPATKVRPQLRPALDSDASKSYQDLRTNLLTRYTDESIKSILFAGTAHGEGASTTAVNFATILARDSRLKVLLGDLNPRTTDQPVVPESDSVHASTDDLSGHIDSKIRVRKIGPGNLHSFVYGGNHSNLIGLLESGGFEQFLKMAYERFDYIILVAPPVLGSLEARAICAKVDGVILVLASGKTRRQIAQKSKETLEEAGGRVLGVILNRRRYYIPSWIYRRL